MLTPISPVASAVATAATAMRTPVLNAPVSLSQTTPAPLAGTSAAAAGSSDATAASNPAATFAGTLGSTLAGATSVAKPVLTAEQKEALKRLHATAQQFESLFVNMVFKSMRAASPQTSISGEKQSSAETTFTEMLDEKRSESMAQTGAFGIAKVLEDQLKASVLANPAQAAKARLAPAGIL